MNLVVSSKTVEAIDSYINNPCVSVIVTGRIGYGVDEIIDFMLDRLTKDKINSVSIKQINNGEESITIDDIRQLKASLKLKNVTNSKNSKRIIVIRNAENITLEAQNSLLKILEEAPKDTLFIFGSQSIEKIIDTVLSRSQTLSIVHPTIKEVCEFYEMEEAEVKPIYLMCDGRPKFIDEIIKKQNTDLKNTFDLAKSYIKSTLFGRLTMCEEILKDYDLKLFVFCLTQIFRSLIIAPVSGSQSRFGESLSVLAETQEDLEKTRPNKKLLMTRLSLNL